MTHEWLAEVAAPVGAAGAVLVLLGPARRTQLAVGFVLLAVAMAMLVVALLPSDDLDRLVSAKGLAALVVGAGAAVAGAWAFVRYPTTVPVVLLLAAPFRLPVELGSQDAFLLLPLYVVLAAASLALLYRAIRSEELAAIPLWIAAPGAALIGWASLSLLWALDPEEGSIALLFFLFPFAALLAVVARSPYAPWLPRMLAVCLVTLATVFAADRSLPGVDAHARLRPGPARRERVRDVLPRHLPLQGPEHLRPPAGARADTARRRALAAARAPAADRRRGGSDLRRPLLLVLPVEPARAVRDGACRLRADCRAAEPKHRHRRCRDGDARCERARRRIGEGRRAHESHERPHAPRIGHRARHRQPPHRRRGHRQPAARGDAGAGDAPPRREERVAHDAADGARRARSRRLRALPRVPGRSGEAALGGLPARSRLRPRSCRLLPRPASPFALLLRVLRGPGDVGRARSRRDARRAVDSGQPSPPTPYPRAPCSVASRGAGTLRLRLPGLAHA